MRIIEIIFIEQKLYIVHERILKINKSHDLLQEKGTRRRTVHRTIHIL